jgi:hypothetical protein
LTANSQALPRTIASIQSNPGYQPNPADSVGALFPLAGSKSVVVASNPVRSGQMLYVYASAIPGTRLIGASIEVTDISGRSVARGRTNSRGLTRLKGCSIDMGFMEKGFNASYTPWVS